MTAHDNDTPASPQQRMTAREFRDAQCFQENQWDDERAEAFAAQDRRKLEESNEELMALVERYLKRIFHSEVNLKMCEARAETAESRLRELGPHEIDCIDPDCPGCSIG